MNERDRGRNLTGEKRIFDMVRHTKIQDKNKQKEKRLKIINLGLDQENKIWDQRCTEINAYFGGRNALRPGSLSVA